MKRRLVVVCCLTTSKQGPKSWSAGTMPALPASAQVGLPDVPSLRDQTPRPALKAGGVSKSPFVIAMFIGYPFRIGMAGGSGKTRRDADRNS